VNLLEAVLVVAALALAFCWAVSFALARWDSPECLGVVTLCPKRLDGHGELIGRYGEAPIYRSVRFKDTDYEFAGVVPPRCVRPIDENELYVEPGLLYVLAGAAPRAAIPQSLR
jgi:hypothetical protein